jgi:hypothetical protein
MKTMGHRDVKTAMHYQHPELEIVHAFRPVSRGVPLWAERRWGALFGFWIIPVEHALG